MADARLKPTSSPTGINPNLPGRVIAQITENVYDMVTGIYLLIPQGSRVIGTYDSVVAFPGLNYRMLEAVWAYWKWVAKTGNGDRSKAGSRPGTPSQRSI